MQTVTATTTTSGDGNYTFSACVKPNTAYQVRIDTSQTPLAGLALTGANAPQPANGDLPATDNNAVRDVADSDATGSGTTAVIAYTTGGPGANNHGLDFGYRAEDWGDLPDSYNTLTTNNGARHIVDATNPTPRLGACVDSEANGHPDASAAGDDSANSPLDFGAACTDDEDGVTVSGNWASGAGQIFVTVSGASACLNAWMDFASDAGAVVPGGDGGFGDSAEGVSEWIIQSKVMAVGVNQPVSFPLPFALPADSYYLRYRLTPNLGDPATCADDVSAYPGNTPTWSGPAEGGEVEDYLVDVAPLALLLADFSATAQDERVLLAWSTVSEIGNQGFNLYRSTEATGPGQQINGALILSQAPGSSQGFAYAWQDDAVAANTTYYYWLEAVDLQSATQRFGPVSVTLTSPTAVELTAMDAQTLPSSVPIPTLLALVTTGASLATAIMVARRRSYRR
jgi:hypothetical protein